jgi:hypothetical protein
MANAMKKTCTCGYTLEAEWAICPYCGRKVGANLDATISTSANLAPTVREEIPPTPKKANVPPPERKTVLYKQPEPTIDAVAWLVGMEGQFRGNDYKIIGIHTIIGGGEDASIILNDELISDRHASIRFGDGVFTITDLDSTNGTYVNGEKVLKTNIADNDVIKIGRKAFTFKVVLLPKKD